MQENWLILWGRIRANWKKAFDEVGASMFGSIGFVWCISYVLSRDAGDKTTWDVFKSYFDGGELSLSILSLSGVLYLLLARDKQAKQAASDGTTPVKTRGIGSFLVFFGPILIATVVIGLNPGFEPKNMGPEKLWLLAFLYVFVHLVWLYTLVFQPVPAAIPTPEHAATEQVTRTGGIEGRAQGRVG